jgi:uncharacterized protein YdeI (YjbR/CyaY-like superfamily)
MDSDVDTSRMTRDIYEMPQDIAAALKSRHLLDAYRGRPAYQQNDYVGWISRSKRGDTRQKRLEQMLEELEGGERYMKMSWNGRKSRS